MAGVGKLKVQIPDIILLTSNEGYDWILVGGIVRASNHGLRMEDVLEALHIPYRTGAVDEKWLEECAGSTPDEIEDFKLADGLTKVEAAE